MSESKSRLQSIKVGDYVICKRDILFFYTKDKLYRVDYVDSSGIKVSSNFSVSMIFFVKENNNFMIENEIFKEKIELWRFSNCFCTIKELRKEKLMKISENK